MWDGHKDHLVRICTRVVGALREGLFLSESFGSCDIIDQELLTNEVVDEVLEWVCSVGVGCHIPKPNHFGIP